MEKIYEDKHDKEVEEVDKPLFWQGIVDITQIPNNLEEIYTEGITWLANPFQDSRVYVSKYSITPDGFSWKLIMNASSRRVALKAAQTLLSYLKEIYTGLDGTIKAKPKYYHHLKKKRPYLTELFLPNPPYIKNKAPLIQRIINLAESNTKHEIKVYIFWQFKDQESDSTLRDKTKSTIKYDYYYNLRVFIETRPKFDKGIEGEAQDAELSGLLDYLIADILNRKPHRAILMKAEIPAQNILTMSELFNRSIRVSTDIYDNDTHIFTKKMRALDFSIPANTPLDKAYSVHNENLGLPVKKPRILLGRAYRRGVLTKTRKYIHLHDLVHHMFISGIPGTGKTSIQALLKKEIKKKGKGIGVLIINLVDEGEEVLYDPDIIIRKGDIDFRVPYFIPDKEIEVICNQVARYLVASLGLKNVVVSITKNVLTKDCINDGVPKQHPKDVFMEVLDWLKARPYHIKFQTNITRAIENRVISLLSSRFIKEILERGPIPKWFIEWINGKTVYLDLHNFTEDGKKLITHAIFQMIRTLLPVLRKKQKNKLKYVIMFDEAHEILEKPKNQSVHDDETVTRHYLEIVFEKLLRAFRKRGIGVIMADHLPRLLFEGVYKLPSIRVIFRSDKDFLRFISNNAEEQDALSNQKNRRALILDGVNARKFAIHTAEFSYEEAIKDDESAESYCPNPKCKATINSEFKFCRECGEII